LGAVAFIGHPPCVVRTRQDQAHDRNRAEGLALQLAGGDQFVDMSLIAREQRAVGFGELDLLPSMRDAFFDKTPIGHQWIGAEE
jgi:hypothetical protein